jgi:hypothetical protein
LGATATAALGAAMGAAPVATEELARTRAGAAPPVTGDGWDPRRVGRIVLISLLALALVAAALLAWRVVAGDAEPAARRDAPPAEETQAAEEETTEAQGASSPQPEPDEFIIEDAIIGMHIKDVERALKEAGLEVARVDVESEEPKDTVVDTDPEPGSRVSAGDEITLYVSTGAVEEEEDDGEEKGPPDVPPGKEKKEKKGKGEDD